MNMKMTLQKVALETILPLRALFLQEVNHQVRYNAVHERGWSDSWLFTADDRAVGYGSIHGREIPDRDTVFEFFVIPTFRRHASDFCRQLLAAARPAFIECQSNDLLLSAMLFEFAHNISSDVILFEEHSVADLDVPGVLVRRRQASDEIFPHSAEPVGE